MSDDTLYYRIDDKTIHNLAEAWHDTAQEWIDRQTAFLEELGASRYRQGMSGAIVAVVADPADHKGWKAPSRKLRDMMGAWEEVCMVPDRRTKAGREIDTFLSSEDMRRPKPSILEKALFGKVIGGLGWMLPSKKGKFAACGMGMQMLGKHWYVSVPAEIENERTGKPGTVKFKKGAKVKLLKTWEYLKLVDKYDKPKKKKKRKKKAA